MIMNRLHIIAVILLLSFQAAFSQSKQIKGVNDVLYEQNMKLQKTLDLKNFEQSDDEFNFRFRNFGQVIEISKDDSIYSGTITNFIYHIKRANRSETETLSNKIELSSKQAEAIYNIVIKSKIINIPTDDEIENWQRGADGITYIVEHADKDTYWLKSYWSPKAKDSIPEAVIVANLVNNITDTLNLQETYSTFKNTLPKRGCYNSGGITYICHAPNSLELGYSGAAKLPLGLYSSYSVNYLGNAQINSSVTLQYNFDNDGFHHLNARYVKWNILYKKSNVSDFLAYNYQNRLLSFNGTKNKFENHQIKYGLNLKNHIGIGVGFDFVSREYDNKFGTHIYAYKWFSEPNIGASLTTSLFNNQINYKAELFKSFEYSYRFPLHKFSLGIAYEDFINYKDLYFSVRVQL